MRDADPATLRPLASDADFAACVELQKEVWGDTADVTVPAAVLKVAQKVGGVTAGAFAPDGRMLGFVFGLSGVRQGRLAHWSHMLAVRAEARDLGLGTRLKLYQRELLAGIGFEVVYWTFDPLVARNAHLNLNRLGATVEEYVLDMYGSESESELHRGIGTDRFIVRWEIASSLAGGERSGATVPDRRPWEEVPAVVAAAAGGAPPPSTSDLPALARVRVEVPADVQVAKGAHPGAGAAWRAATRRAFLFYLGRGLAVTGFYRDPVSGRCFYCLC